VIAVVLVRRPASTKRVVAQSAFASGGLALGFVSIWLTPSEFGFGGNFVQEPSTEVNVGVLIGMGAAAAFLTLAIIEEVRRRRVSIEPVAA
ncbi:MAG TPA: hypothetical protein VGE14_06400, partial [Marmoricola sp.]